MTLCRTAWPGVYSCHKSRLADHSTDHEKREVLKDLGPAGMPRTTKKTATALHVSCRSELQSRRRDGLLHPLTQKTGTLPQAPHRLAMLAGG